MPHVFVNAFAGFPFLWFFFFNDTATTEIYTLSLHDALPICGHGDRFCGSILGSDARSRSQRDRKSTRLNSSHMSISYAVFCLKKKKKKINVGVIQENYRLIGRI